MGERRVVVGVDGSPLSMAAVTRAAQVASARGLPLHVLHAFAPDLPMLGFGAVDDDSVVTTHTRRLLADATAHAHAVDPALRVTSGSRDGYASQALVDASRTAALVAVGAMGHGVLSRASVGAVAMQVVTHARCPVLVVGHETPDRAGGRVVVGQALHLRVDGQHHVAVLDDLLDDGLVVAVDVGPEGGVGDTREDDDRRQRAGGAALLKNPPGTVERPDA